MVSLPRFCVWTVGEIAASAAAQRLRCAPCYLLVLSVCLLCTPFRLPIDNGILPAAVDDYRVRHVKGTCWPAVAGKLVTLSWLMSPPRRWRCEIYGCNCGGGVDMRALSVGPLTRLIGEAGARKRDAERGGIRLHGRARFWRSARREESMGFLSAGVRGRPCHRGHPAYELTSLRTRRMAFRTRGFPPRGIWEPELANTCDPPHLLEQWAMVPAGRNRNRNRSHRGPHDAWAPWGGAKQSIEREERQAGGPGSQGQPTPIARCDRRLHFPPLPSRREDGRAAAISRQF